MRKLANLHTYRDATGVFRCYVRRKGAASISIAGKIGSPAFMAAYRAALKSQRQPKPKPKAPELPQGPHIYFIAAGEFIKIGKSSRSGRRVSEIQTGSPLGLEVLLTVPGGHKTERQMHAKFRHLRERGEWFRAGPDLLAYIEAQKNEARLSVATDSQTLANASIKMLEMKG